MPRKPLPGGRKSDEKKVALVFTAEQTRYRNGINVTAAHRSNNPYSNQSTRRWVAVCVTAIASLLPAQQPLEDGESHEDERQGPANGASIAEITDLKAILIEIHHDRQPPVFGTRTIQEDKRQFEELQTAEQRQQHDKASHRGNLGQDHREKFLPGIGAI